METKIKWNEGDGYITATYEGSGSGSAAISSDANEGIDREQTISVETTDGISKVDVKVSQVGLREVFNPSDGAFVPSDGGTFNVLKKSGEQALYTELEYIETSGTQWIDSSVQGPLSVQARLQGVKSGNSSRVVLSMNGRVNSGSWLGFTTVWTVGGGYNFENGYDEIVDVTCAFDGAAVKATIDGVVVSRAGSNSGSLYLGSPSSTYPSYCRIFGVKIDKDGVLVRDFIPVLDKDDIACMYDKVSEEFFYNKGTGNFIEGGKI